ncbi:MAG: anthrone oxygenase family protein [Acidimicrobiales bacterium]
MLDHDHTTSTIATTATESAGSAARLALLGAITLVGLSAGFFVAYLSSVTRGLAEVGDTAYVETFQAINASVRNPLFGLVFFGPVPALVLAIATNWAAASTPRRVLMAAALPLYLATIAITGTGNVPLNNDLAEVVVSSPEVAAAARAAFEDDWNRFNLMRTVAVVASFVSLGAAATLVDD